jgi:hypothetical protein
MHTPGPWVIQNADDHYNRYQIEGAGGWGIIIRVEDMSNEAPDNARLLAVAPELLAALEAVVRTCHGDPMNEAARKAKAEALYAAAAVIRTARGQ